MSADVLDAPPAAAPVSTPAATPATILQSAPAATPDAPAADWRTELPEAYKDPALAPFLGFESRKEMEENLAKSYLETKKLVGAKLAPPSEKSTPEEVAKWRRIVGAPDTPEGYGETLRPDAVPEEQWDKETEGKLRELVHKHHLQPAAVKELMDLYGESVRQGLDKFSAGEAAHVAKEIQTLKSEWGGGYDANVSVAQRFALTIGLKPDDPIFTSAEVVRAMARGARLISESRLVQGGQTAVQGGNRAQITEIQDPKSQSQLAREYRGEFGSDAQLAAQNTLHALMRAPNL